MQGGNALDMSNTIDFNIGESTEPLMGRTVAGDKTGGSPNTKKLIGSGQSGLSNLSEDLENAKKPDSSSSDDSDSSSPSRGVWGNQLEFILTCVGFAVGLGNVWRFPYLCYRNGGGAFLIPYIIMLALVGLPLFFMELCLGQFASLGPITVWKINPTLKGLGVGMVLTSWFINLYYNVVISHVLLFMFESMRTVVPWASCGNYWNTFNCTDDNTFIVRNISDYSSSDIVNMTSTGWTQLGELIYEDPEAAKAMAYRNDTFFEAKTPSQEFYSNYILNMTGGIDDLGNLNWRLTLTLLLAWIIVLVCLIKGVQSLGKVVYFTAIFPYIMLTILLIRGLTLEGSSQGLIFYLKPDFTKLTEPRVWSDAATQIFYSLSACCGGLIAMSSYSKFTNNCYRDAILVSLINCGTSIYAGLVIFSVLGFMAHKTGKDVADVAEGGPGLAFVVYPEAISRMPMAPVWAVFFFFMMATLGFGSQFSLVECVLSGFADEFKSYLNTRWKNITYRSIMILFSFMLGLPMVTRGGIYLLNLVDYSIGGFPLLFIGFFECIGLMWIYGQDRFLNDIQMMLGHKPNMYWKICWKYVTPTVVLATILFNVVLYAPPYYEHSKQSKYYYPTWALVISWLIIFTPIMVIPGWLLYKFCRQGGWQLLTQMCQPARDWGPALSENRTGMYAAGCYSIVIQGGDSNGHHETSYYPPSASQMALTGPAGSASNRYNALIGSTSTCSGVIYKVNNPQASAAAAGVSKPPGTSAPPRDSSGFNSLPIPEDPAASIPAGAEFSAQSTASSAASAPPATDPFYFPNDDKNNETDL